MVETTEKSQFNMGIATLELIHMLRTSASTRYLSGDMFGWYYALKQIKMQIISKLKKDERQTLKTLEMEIENVHKDPKVIELYKKTDKLIRESDSFKTKIKNIFCPKIERYNEILMDLMEQKGLLLPNQEDETKFA